MKLKNLLLSTLAMVVFVGCNNSKGLYSNDNPKANEKAVIIAGNARFTVLTSQMIRMEWAENGIFEDNATLTFINRNLPVPKFTVEIGRAHV